MDLHKYQEYVADLSEKGGPLPSQYSELSFWYHTLWNLLRSGDMSRTDIKRLWHTGGDAYSTKTLQGHACRKPYGYAGDYEIIDRIYQGWVSQNPRLANWDRFFHAQAAPRAVRNRKAYFLTLLAQLESQTRGTMRVLNVGSGPSRDIYEYLSANPSSRVHFHCVDIDAKAIEFSQSLLSEFTENVTFECKNVFKLRHGDSCSRYDLVWSAGLFDYLDDKRFIYLLQKLACTVAPGGKLVVGNFDPLNPTRAYMEFAEWCLNHRDKQHLIRLAKTSGFKEEQLLVDSEPERVNLFLNICAVGSV